MKAINILVLCTGNSCRSQMAHGFLHHFASDKATIYSAGIETHGVNSLAVYVMQELGIDISQHSSNHVDEYKNIEFDFVITVCDHAKEHCPLIISHARSFHQNFSDPSKLTGNDVEILNAFRKTRDEIKYYCKEWVSTHL